MRALILAAITLTLTGCITSPTRAVIENSRYETCINASGNYTVGPDQDWSCTLPAPSNPSDLPVGG